MSTPDPDRTGAARDTGAVRDGTRKRGLLPLFLPLGLLALIALALILYFSLRGTAKKAAIVAPAIPVATSATPAPATSPAPVDASSATAGGNPAAPVAPASPATVGTPAPGASPEATNTAAAPVSPSAGTTPGSITINGGLVGGGAVTPKPATGTLAAGDTLGTVLFAENSAALTANADTVIANAAKVVKADRPAKIFVSGYTDAIAGQPTNLTLSGARAKAVLAALHKDVGPGPTAYATRDHGENDPLASNTTENGRQQNRRATVTTD